MINEQIVSFDTEQQANEYLQELLSDGVLSAKYPDIKFSVESYILNKFNIAGDCAPTRHLYTVTEENGKVRTVMGKYMHETQFPYDLGLTFNENDEIFCEA